jgi:hypothetical protein
VQPPGLLHVERVHRAVVLGLEDGTVTVNVLVPLELGGPCVPHLGMALSIYVQ